MDDLKPADNPTQGTTPQPSAPQPNPLVGDKTMPRPTPPGAAPTAPGAPPSIEPKKPSPPQAFPTQTTVTSEAPPPTPSVSKPPGKKISSKITIGGALILLLMAATLPATVIIVQNQTQITPKAEEVVPTPTPIVKPTKAAKTFIALTESDQESIQVGPIKPQNLEIETVSPGSTKITFSTQGAYPSLIRYSPDEDWNYLTMLQEGDTGNEWQQRYNSQNQVNVEPVGGSQASTSHEFLLENLVAGQKYYFVIEIEKTEENIVYLFGLEQPENYYTFVAE